MADRKGFVRRVVGKFGGRMEKWRKRGRSRKAEADASRDLLRGEARDREHSSARVTSMSVAGILADIGDRTGVVWTLEDGEDLNVNLVRFPTGGVSEHINDEVDVVLLCVSGEGVVTVDGMRQCVSAGELVFVPKDSRRSTWGSSPDFAYFTIHRRRGPIRIGA